MHLECVFRMVIGRVIQMWTEVTSLDGQIIQLANIMAPVLQEVILIKCRIYSS